MYHTIVSIDMLWGKLCVCGALEMIIGFLDLGTSNAINVVFVYLTVSMLAGLTISRYDFFPLKSLEIL